MGPVLTSLLEYPGLTTAAALAAPSVVPGDEGTVVPLIRGWFAPGRLHELIPVEASGRAWDAPLTCLATLVGEGGSGCVAWVGRACWPTLSCFRRPGDRPGDRGVRQVFLDPLTDAERAWGLAEAANCPGVRVVVADGSGLDLAATRRIQLAAERSGARVFLARPPWEADAPSWAATRWRVRPLVSSTFQPRWDIALVRAKGARPGQDASGHWILEWSYEVFRGTGTVRVFPVVGSGLGEPARRQPRGQRFARA